MRKFSGFSIHCPVRGTEFDITCLQVFHICEALISNFSILMQPINIAVGKWNFRRRKWRNKNL